MKQTSQSIQKRRFWRAYNSSKLFGLTELKEIYIAMFVRGIGLSMVGLFVPIYLNSIGYSLASILTLVTCYFATRIWFDIAAAYGVAYFGPKHVMFFGQILFAISSALFLSLQSITWPLWLMGAVWGASQSCFFLSFDVDFSKVKHSAQGGLELGRAEIMGKLGALLGPLAGGLVSITFGPRYIFAVSTALLIIGLLPLFKTREPVRLRQKLHFRTFPLHKVSGMIPSIVALHLENTLCIMLWPLFIALIIIPNDTVFLRVGIISTISMLVAIVATRVAGRFTDTGHARPMLITSAWLNAGIHLLRPLVSSFGMLIPLDIVNQTVTAGYRIPFMKLHYDMADKLPGYRIVYVAFSESLSSIIKTTVYGVLALLSTMFSAYQVLSAAFVIAAIASMVISAERFGKQLGIGSVKRA